MILAHRIRLDPNNVQRTWLDRCAGAARFTYNWGLARWQEAYTTGDKPNWRKLNAELNTIKAEKFAWLCTLPWKIPNQALEDLGTAFQHFFRRVKVKETPGYPRFKKKGRCSEGFAIEARALVFDKRRVKLPKLGWLRMREVVRFPGKVLAARFTKRTGYWYLSVQVEVAETWVYPHRCKTQAVVGVDLGVCDLAVLSTCTERYQ
jgi:putative transposase